MRHVVAGTLLFWTMYCAQSVHEAATPAAEWVAFLSGSLACAAALSLVCERGGAR